MRKRIILLAVLVILCIIGGGFYTTLAKHDTGGVNEYACSNPFPYEMPAVVMHPAIGYALF